MPDLLAKGVWTIAAAMTLILVWLVAKAVFPFALGAAVGAGSAYWYLRNN
jgi:hypothetical protein